MVAPKKSDDPPGFGEKNTGRFNFLLSTNRGRVIILFGIALIPLISYWEEIRLALATSRSAGIQRSDELVAEAFNSYKLNIPIFEAIKSNDLKLVIKLLEGGVVDKRKKQKSYYNVNAEDQKGITPLIEATLLGNVELVELLLIHGARAQPAPGFRHTPLRAACLTANPELITLLLQKGADPNALSEGNRTPLMGACYLRPQLDEAENRMELSLGAVKLMLQDSRTDVRIRNDFGESAMDLCKERGYTKSVAFLRDRMGQKRLTKM